MYIKESFKRSSIYHIAVGIIIILLGTIGLVIDPSFASLIISGLVMGIGTGVAYAGYKLLHAHRVALWCLIIFNGLQLVSFDLDHAFYTVIFGPYVHFDIFDPGFAFGIQAQGAFEYATKANTTQNAFKLSLTHLTFFIYFLDQLRFVPKSKVAQPWESEV